MLSWYRSSVFNLCMIYLGLRTAAGSVMHQVESSSSVVPIVLWHGMGDSCCNPFSMGSVKSLLEEKIPGVYVHSLMIGSNVVADTENGFFMGIEDQINLACDTIRNDTRLVDGFHGVGFSQGGLFMRGLVERCGDLVVKSLVSIGGPQQGVYGLPHCLGENHVVCDYMRRLLNYGAYTSWIQGLLVQAQYWHDPLAEQEYVEKSLFLADINNQGQTKKKEYSENMKKLEKFLLVKFTKDTMVDPKESEWFGWFDNADVNQMRQMNETLLYKEDWIGLRALDEGGRLHFLEVDGDHLHLDAATFNYIISNYLV